MAYCSVAEVSASTGEGWLNDDSSGIITSIITIADLKVKAWIKKAGLTPPTSDDICKVASIELCKADLIRRGRFTGSIAKVGANPDTYDSINRAIKFYYDSAKDLVDAYIASAQTNVQSSDVNGQIRSDYVFDDLKLHQGDIAEPTNINGDSLADDQRD